MKRPAAVLLSAALLAATPAGCDSGKHSPATVVVLPDPKSAVDLSDTSRAVQLEVGQSLGVQVKHHDGPSNWQQADAGDTKLLKPDGEHAVEDCPAGQAGCGATTQELYRAAAAGTTTIEWHYVGMGPGNLPAGVPTAACPSFGATARCPIGVLKIVVTIR